MSYSVSVLKDWLLVWLLLYTTTVNKCTGPHGGGSRPEPVPCSGEGDIRVIGTNTTYLIAGRIEICYEMEWRAVCHDGWSLEDAMVVCRQLGFDPQETGHCRHSCFGRRDIEGTKDFACTGTEAKLITCQPPAGEANDNCQHAGVICAMEPPEQITPSPTCPPPTCDCPSTSCPTHSPCPSPTSSLCTASQPCNCPATPCPQTSPPTVTPLPRDKSRPGSAQVTPLPCDCPASTTLPLLSLKPSLATISASTQDTSSTPEHSTGAGEEQTTKTATCTAIGGGLGALAAGLALIMVGVVMGWVWHCYRSRGKSTSNFQSSSGINSLPNPTYSALSQPHPSIQYSSHGPRDTPLNPSNPTAETSFATYDVVGSPAHTPSQDSHAPLPDRVYQVLEDPQSKERGVARKGGEEADYQDLDEEGGGEGDYHVLGEIGGGAGGLTYEVPMPTKMSVQQDPTDMDYSKLQHK